MPSPIYNTIGTNYNSTRQADPYITSRLLDFLNPQKGEHYLDIGCGTGNYTIALAKHGLNFTGVEPSEKMLNEARQRNQKINWLKGTAENIPAGDNTFNAVIATLTIHHWANLNTAFKEIHRVAKPGARFILFTATPTQMTGYWLNYYFPKMMQASIMQMPSAEEISDALIASGFSITTTEKYAIGDDLKDRFLYAGKNNPEIYLDAEVRKGISSFAALANADEVNAGLKTLSADIETGAFTAIKQQYDNSLEDYLFILAQKI